jgi:hypothetical protein
MQHRSCAALLLVALAPSSLAASVAERIKNQKVLVTEDSLAPGESEQIPDKVPSMVVYMTEGTAVFKLADGESRKDSVNEGQTEFQPAETGTMQNVGSSPLHFVRIEFLTSGSPETWGMAGLSPHYKMLLEDQYARAYDIKIPAQSREPQHTHHDRVVVALSGAKLEHILPSGQIQPSTLKTGEVVWRIGGTHIGHNMGDTDLWVIAVEPK